MIDIANSVNQIIDSKLTHLNYNEDDEYNITEILKKLCTSKKICK